MKAKDLIKLLSLMDENEMVNFVLCNDLGSTKYHVDSATASIHRGERQPVGVNFYLLATN